MLETARGRLAWIPHSTGIIIIIIIIIIISDATTIKVLFLIFFLRISMFKSLCRLTQRAWLFSRAHTVLSPPSLERHSANFFPLFFLNYMVFYYNLCTFEPKRLRIVFVVTAERGKWRTQKWEMQNEIRGTGVHFDEHKLASTLSRLMYLLQSRSRLNSKLIIVRRPDAMTTV